jgi:diaminopimelate epimerase
MKLTFSKMHGAGNDFLVVARDFDNHPLPSDMIRRLCDRHRGVGADGILFVGTEPGSAPGDADGFRMVFFNRDGSRASMCGNGLRCAALFAAKRLTRRMHLRFRTDAGVLGAEMAGPELVRIEMLLREVPRKLEIGEVGPVWFCDTGVPHCVCVAECVADVDVMRFGALIRNHPSLAPAGANVNFVEIPVRAGGAPVRIRTYERGVEAETNACGTGITASAVALSIFKGVESPICFITSDGDELTVEFERNGDSLRGLSLTGPAAEVFTGDVRIEAAFE